MKNIRGYSAKNPFYYQTETDIPGILEAEFGSDSGNYFVLTQQTIKDPRSKDTFEVLLVEDKKEQTHTLFFKKQ